MKHLGFYEIEELRNNFLNKCNEIIKKLVNFREKAEFLDEFVLLLYYYLKFDVNNNLLDFTNTIDKILDYDFCFYERNWNSPENLFFFLLIFDYLSPIIDLANIQREISKFLEDFWIYINNNLEKWQNTLEDELVILLPFFIYFRKDNPIRIKASFDKFLILCKGNNLVTEWLLSLQSSLIEDKSIIYSNPFANELINFSLFWLNSDNSLIFEDKMIKNEIEKVEKLIYSEKIEGKLSLYFRRLIFLTILNIKAFESKFTKSKEILGRQLPFFELSDREFERLIYWIIQFNGKWKDIQWRGASGSEKGKDIFARNVETGQIWIFQMKKVKSFGPREFEKEFINVLPELKNYNAAGYYLILTINPSDKLRKKIEQFERKIPDLKIKVCELESLNIKVKSDNRLLWEFFKIKL